MIARPASNGIYERNSKKSREPLVSILFCNSSVRMSGSESNRNVRYLLYFGSPQMRKDLLLTTSNRIVRRLRVAL